MEEVPVFARASAADVSALAASAREVRAAAGETLFNDGDAPAIYLLVTGELALEPLSGGAPVAAGAGDTVGVYETLSGADTTGWRAHVTRDGAPRRARERRGRERRRFTNVAGRLHPHRGQGGGRTLGGEESGR